MCRMCSLGTHRASNGIKRIASCSLREDIFNQNGETSMQYLAGYGIRHAGIGAFTHKPMKSFMQKQSMSPASGTPFIKRMALFCVSHEGSPMLINSRVPITPEQRATASFKRQYEFDDPPCEKEFLMGRIPTGDVIWSLRRSIRDGNLWDRACSRCKQVTPVFEYEHRDEQGDRRRPVFGSPREGCTRKKLAEWLLCAESPDYAHLGYQTDFAITTVFYEQKKMKKPWY